MDLKDIEKIMKLMDAHGLQQFKLERDDTTPELKKPEELDIETIQKLMPPPMMQQQPVYAPAAQAGPPTSDGGGEPAGSGLGAGVEEIKSPMVGTFYIAEKPEADPYVKVGDKVADDTTVCTIEAMKVFNTIAAEKSGEIVKVLVENGSPVQFGEALFHIKTA